MIRVSLNKTNDKKLSIRFQYNAETVAKIKTISGARFINKKDDKHWTIDYFKIKKLIETFGEDNVIIDKDVNINYNMVDKYDFSHELELFNDVRFTSFATWCLTKAPLKFFTEPAAFYTKHHPEYAHGEGGLSRHTAGAMRICYSMKEMNEYSDNEMDIALIALLLHDFAKFGYKECLSEKILFEHPLLSAQLIEESFEEYKKNENVNSDVLYVYNNYWPQIKKAIRSHMGRFNTKEDDEGNTIVLPIPNDKISKLVHLSDYLSSRNFIEINFNKKLKSNKEQ